MMIAGRFAAIVRYMADDDGFYTEMGSVPALRAFDAFQAVRVRHVIIPFSISARPQGLAGSDQKPPEAAGSYRRWAGTRLQVDPG